MDTVRSKLVHNGVKRIAYTLLAAFVALTTACSDFDAVKNELVKKFQTKLVKKKSPFIPRDGITVRAGSLYQTANGNSEVLMKLPPETPVFLVDKVGEFYRVRTRDGKEGYLDLKVVGGEDMIEKTQELKRSIEGIPPQAEGVIKTKANFRLEAGKQYEVVEALAPGKKFEMYERVVTLRPSEKNQAGKPKPTTAVEEVNRDETGDEAKKDVWYKVKIEDGRVGYIYTHNMELTAPEDLAGAVPFMRIIGWRQINSTDDPDRGAKSNYIAAYAPIGKDAGCDFTRLYYVSWSTRLKKRSPTLIAKINGVLPITSYQFEGKPGFSVRSLHPTKRDKLIIQNYVFAKGAMKKVGEEEIPHSAVLH